MDKGAWQVTVLPGYREAESDTTYRLNNDNTQCEDY